MREDPRARALQSVGEVGEIFDVDDDRGTEATTHADPRLVVVVLDRERAPRVRAREHLGGAHRAPALRVKSRTGASADWSRPDSDETSLRGRASLQARHVVGSKRIESPTKCTGAPGSRVRRRRVTTDTPSRRAISAIVTRVSRAGVVV